MRGISLVCDWRLLVLYYQLLERTTCFSNRIVRRGLQAIGFIEFYLATILLGCWWDCRNSVLVWLISVKLWRVLIIIYHIFLVLTTSTRCFMWLVSIVRWRLPFISNWFQVPLLISFISVNGQILKSMSRTVLLICNLHLLTLD